MLSMMEYLDKSKAFPNGKSDDFPQLVEDGCRLVGKSYRQFAQELEIMPSTVLRWASGSCVPTVATQRVVVSRLHRQVVKALAAQSSV